MEKNTFKPLNPTDEQRHEILRMAFRKAGRLEDFNNVVKLMSPPKDIMNIAKPGEFKGLKVGIIGGGLAGLSAAFELRKLGYDITIFDALEDRIGGRVYTHYFDKQKNYYGELGAMRIPVSHETTWHYINLFKLNTAPFIQTNPNNFVYVHSTRVRNDIEGKNITEKVYPKYNLTPWEKNTPWPKLYDYALNSYLNRLSPSIRKEILQELPDYAPQYKSLINSSIRNIFESLRLSEEAINLIGSIDCITGAFLYLSYNEALQDSYPLSFTELYRIVGGTVNLPLSFYNSLIAERPKEYSNIPLNKLGKIVWKSSHTVNGIFKSDTRKGVIIKYSTKNSLKDLMEYFDYVICTIPFSTLRAVEINPLFSNRKMQAIRELNYIDIQKTYFLCNKRFWEENNDYGRIIGGVSFTDLLIQSIVYPSDHAICLEKDCSPYEPGVLLASYNFNQDAARLGSIEDKERFKLIKRQVEEVHGLSRKYLDEIVSDYKTIQWNSERAFRGGLAILTPQQKRIFLYDMLKPEYDDRIFFAGEHTSSVHGWMQGSLYSGKQAANSLAYNTNIHRIYR